MAHASFLHSTSHAKSPAVFSSMEVERTKERRRAVPLATLALSPSPFPHEHFQKSQKLVIVGEALAKGENICQLGAGQARREREREREQRQERGDGGSRMVNAEIIDDEEAVACTPTNVAEDVDPRYEFCAPRYHDFSSEKEKNRRASGTRDGLTEEEKQEELEADEWFRRLNEGLIDTDLSTPRSRACGYPSSSPSTTTVGHQENDASKTGKASGEAAGAKRKRETRGSILNALKAADDDESGDQPGAAETGNGKAESAQDKPSFLKTRAKRQKDATVGKSSLRPNPTTMRLRSRMKKNLRITVPQSPMLSTKSRSLLRRKARGADSGLGVALTTTTKTRKKATVATRSTTRRIVLDSPAFRMRSRSRLVRAAKPQGRCGSVSHGGAGARLPTRASLRPQGKKIAKKTPRKTLSKGTSKRKVLTRPQPFNLRGTQLHKRAQENLELLRTQRDAREKRMSTQFKARPSATMKRAPFKPIKENANTSAGVAIEVAPMKLKSASRATERKNWNEQQRLRRLKLEEEKRAEEKRKDEEDRVSLKKLRKQREFKARPLPRYLR